MGARWNSRSPVFRVSILVALCICGLIPNLYYVGWIADSKIHITNVTSVSSSEGNVAKRNFSHGPRFEGDPVLHFIPDSVFDTWVKRNFLVVFGIPSEDIHARERRRNLQRMTCWQFPGVATQANNYLGPMLVLYVLGKHFSHEFLYSRALEAEAQKWNDILTLEVSEIKNTYHKEIGRLGLLSTDVSIELSRKTFLWYQWALHNFPNASYLAKGDDDMFLRVPQYLADLSVLPRNGTYWGAMMKAKKYRTNRVFYFVLGPCMTISRDLVIRLIDYKPLRNLFEIRYTKENEAQFYSLSVQHEDVMVGRVFMALRQPNMTYVMENICRFHDVHSGHRVRRVSRSSVMIHHLREEEYMRLFLQFKGEVSPAPKRHRPLSRHRFEISC